MKDEIIASAQRLFAIRESAVLNVSEATRAAQQVCRDWQVAVRCETVQTEVRVNDWNEKIDVVDFAAATAYEMKASPNNPHHEFYKDIFKILAFNKVAEVPIRRLFFLTVERGAKRLRGNLGHFAAELVRERHGLDVVVETIGDGG